MMNEVIVFEMGSSKLMLNQGLTTIGGACINTKFVLVFYFVMPVA